MPLTEDEADRIGAPPHELTAATDPSMTTVRDATFDVFRRFGLTTIFANPGSTEIAFLTGLPDDLEFVLALHEGSVVGIATGYATATRPSGVGQPAHHRRAGQRGRRARHRAHQPRHRWW